MKKIILLLLFTFMLPLHAQRTDFNKINFLKADEIADQHKDEELNNLPLLAYNLTSSLSTDVERFRAIYYWVCHNISCEYDLMNTNKRMPKKLKNDPDALLLWKNQFKKEVFTKLLKEKKTLCIGYAYLIKELSNLAGLECEIIYGFGTENNVKSKNIKKPNHSWNAIKLNGKWYLCDATWSSGFIDMSTYFFEFNYEDAYFLMEPDTFLKSHKPIDEKWTLLVQNPELNIN